MTNNDNQNNPKMNRRNFLKKIIAGGTAAALAGIEGCEQYQSTNSLSLDPLNQERMNKFGIDFKEYSNSIEIKLNRSGIFDGKMISGLKFELDNEGKKFLVVEYQPPQSRQLSSSQDEKQPFIKKFEITKSFYDNNIRNLTSVTITLAGQNNFISQESSNFRISASDDIIERIKNIVVKGAGEVGIVHVDSSLENKIRRDEGLLTKTVSVDKQR